MQQNSTKTNMTEKETDEITYTDRSYYLITAITLFLAVFLILNYIIFRRNKRPKKR
jgi:hypothetical protein